MRFRTDRFSRPFHAGLVTISLGLGLAACGGANDVQVASASSAVPVNGPQADYPVRVGEPYLVGDIEYKPSDTLNYDHVGYLVASTDTVGYTATHHTLPMPSYVEVTSLDSGRTILVRVEHRGPMDSHHLLALSPAAMAQLEATHETPIRVRRTVPPEDHRALLRSGNAAPLRMDTPASLLAVLQRRLPSSGTASLGAKAEGEAQAQAPDPSLPTESSIEHIEIAASNATLATVPVIASEAEEGEVVPAEAAAAFSPPPVEPDVSYLVQAATFSTADRAERVANVLGGAVRPSGRYFQVRTGPFLTRGEAEASLANVRRAGYSDARILTSG